MSREFALNHYWAAECRHLLGEVASHRDQAQQLEAKGASEEMIADELALMARAAIKVRAIRSYLYSLRWSKKLATNEAHQVVLRMAELLSSAISASGSIDHGQLYSLNATQWVAIIDQYEREIAGERLSLPIAEALQYAYGSIQHDAFVVVIAKSKELKSEALAAANKWIAQPGSDQLRTAAEERTREFRRVLREAICLANSSHDWGQIEEICTVGYAPLDQVGE